jgi:hypothetical protein
MPESREHPPGSSRFAALILLLVALVLLAVWIVVATSAMFGAKAVVETYLAPDDAGSTTGLAMPATGGF